MVWWYCAFAHLRGNIGCQSLLLCSHENVQYCTTRRDIDIIVQVYLTKSSQSRCGLHSTGGSGAPARCAVLVVAPRNVNRCLASADRLPSISFDWRAYQLTDQTQAAGANAKSVNNKGKTLCNAIGPLQAKQSRKASAPAWRVRMTAIHDVAGLVSPSLLLHCKSPSTNLTFWIFCGGVEDATESISRLIDHWCWLVWRKSVMRDAVMKKRLIRRRKGITSFYRSTPYKPYILQLHGSHNVLKILSFVFLMQASCNE